MIEQNTEIVLFEDETPEAVVAKVNTFFKTVNKEGKSHKALNSHVFMTGNGVKIFVLLVWWMSESE